jgi:putative membrane-bound dehydrogenase-like protein
MGAQFQRHGTGIFRTQTVSPDHPIMSGLADFESWDETYVHHLHNETDRTVLSYRVDDEGREPWTWIRTHGSGRVFYTAWGHDQRTWGHPGFQNLVERGIRWAAGDDPSVVPTYTDPQAFPVPPLTPQRTDVEPFEYVDVGAKIPNYVPSARWGTQGDPFNQMQKPLAPAESLKHIVLPVGFRAELYAAEPELGGKPICMAWDDRGRLWVSETYDYPNELQPSGSGRDRIRICEDTDGDWRADKFTVFAEKLSIPTSIAFWRGGAIVQNGTETIYLRDTDGDDVADERQLVFAGWNQSDTHGGVSNFQYGLDNWIWAMQGYNFSEPTINGQAQQGFRMGFWRFRPDGTAIEFLRSTNNNTWGLGLSEEGLVFGSTANRVPSVFMPLPNRYYEQVRGWTPSLTLDSIANTFLFQTFTDKVRQVDQHGGYTAGAGHALYTARNYPREYWNRTAFVCEPSGHLVGTFVLRGNGAGFKSQYTFNLLASDDEWTAPIMAEVGPDGNVWVTDWYNYIVQHNPTPAGFETGRGNAYETQLRDKRHGRIYRIVYDEAAASQPMSLADADAATLVATLRNDNMFWRKHAQRRLVERGQLDVVPQLIELASDRSVDAIGLNAGVIHALWTLHGLGALDGSQPSATAAAVSALTHPSAGVRRNAVQVLPANTDSVEQLLATNLLDDPDAQVRLAALLALADLPPTKAGGAAVARMIQMEQNLSDNWMVDAATAAAAHHDLSFLEAIASAPAASTTLSEMISTVAEHYARGGPGQAGVKLFASLEQAQPSIIAAVLTGLVSGWPEAHPVEVSDTLADQLDRIMQRLEPAQRGGLVKLAARWGSDRFAKYAAETVRELLAQVDDDQAPATRRIRAARQLFDFQPNNASVVSDVLDRITPQLSPELIVGLLDALSLSESQDVGPALTAKFPAMTPDARTAALSVLMQRKPATAALLKSIEDGTIPLQELSLDQRQTLTSHPDRSLRQQARQLLERGGALPSPDRQQVLTDLAPLAEKTGDSVAGKEVFKKICAKCHMHSGEGSRIGPDLTGMAVHPKHELLQQILDPNRSVESNFRAYTVVTTDGQVLTGMLASESRTAIELFNAEGEKKTVLREDIDELIASRKSLMPEGFEKQISQTELCDLLEFMTKRGRFVPVDISKSATIASDRGMFNDPRNNAERLIFSDWAPQSFQGIPFQLIDPRSGRIPNVILLQSSNGAVTRRMPKTATIPAGGPAKAIHLLSGVSGWGFPYGERDSVSMIVRLHYADGQTEDHPLKNGVHFADYIRRVDVPESQLAFMLRGQQLRYLRIEPQRTDSIDHIEFVKGPDSSAPVVMSVTLETR